MISIQYLKRNVNIFVDNFLLNELSFFFYRQMLLLLDKLVNFTLCLNYGIFHSLNTIY